MFEDETGEVIIDCSTDGIINFNGEGDNGHENLVLSRTPKEFEFCKTNRKPYDLLVVATLVLYKYHFPKKVEISSDGGNEVWRKSYGLIAKALPDSSVVLELAV